jgi:hypothetical protein
MHIIYHLCHHVDIKFVKKIQAQICFLWLYGLHVLTFNGNSNQCPKVDVDHVIFDPIQIKVKINNNKKWWNVWNESLLPHAWATKFTMGIISGGCSWEVHKGIFKVLTKIEMHNKLLVSKLDFLSKHGGQKMATTIIPNVATMIKCNIWLLF